MSFESAVFRNPDFQSRATCKLHCRLRRDQAQSVFSRFFFNPLNTYCAGLKDTIGGAERSVAPGWYPKISISNTLGAGKHDIVINDDLAPGQYWVAIQRGAWRSAVPLVIH